MPPWPRPGLLRTIRRQSPELTLRAASALYTVVLATKKRKEGITDD